MLLSRSADTGSTASSEMLARGLIAYQSRLAERVRYFGALSPIDLRA